MPIHWNLSQVRLFILTEQGKNICNSLTNREKKKALHNNNSAFHPCKINQHHGIWGAHRVINEIENHWHYFDSKQKTTNKKKTQTRKIKTPKTHKKRPCLSRFMNTVPFSWFPLFLQFSCLPPSYKVTRSPYNQKIFKELKVREKQMTC